MHAAAARRQGGLQSGPSCLSAAGSFGARARALGRRKHARTPPARSPARQVVVVKMNPVNDYLGPLLRKAFAPLVEAGFVEFAYGGAGE
jgi:hypothetical protein